ncbi:transposase, YhgA-like family protein [Orientia tsutsugamushi str. Gilliam]|uniref:Transposase, YhgA-like family protein n=1 Tax=Orientia tsutsugamushi str. Gilliam TaxID=1359184 RepID=A0A0F3M7X7_ORITS|nr:Rpn family recombination-promoting nuclease/putative transposase [Orientia tsutsugamushi]KJV50694.1 transposase, YhgA-like family protein [Orientia tsutsugamushi str. Gilliam]
MSESVAAQEFLEYYLPSDFKSLIDFITNKIEQESYIENRKEKNTVISSIELLPKTWQCFYLYIN